MTTQPKSTLYDLTGAWIDLYMMADDPDMEANVEAWFDTMEAIEGEIEDKADGYAKVIAQLSADADGLKKEEERLYQRRQAIDNRIRSMKRRLQEMMEATGKTKFKTTLFSFNIQNNAPSVVIDDESKIPAEYWVQKAPEISKTAIKDYLKGLAEGETCEFAHLTQTQSLRIR